MRARTGEASLSKEWKEEDQRVGQGWTRDRIPDRGGGWGGGGKRERGWNESSNKDWYLRRYKPGKPLRARLRESQTEEVQRGRFRRRNRNLDRDRHRHPRERQIHSGSNRQMGRQAQEKGHCLSIQGTQAEAGSWKTGHAKHEAETSGLLGQGCRPWGGFLSGGAGGKSQREVAMAAGWPGHAQNAENAGPPALASPPAEANAWRGAEAGRLPWATPSHLLP